MLFGCSSGYLKPNGVFDPDGIALQYLKAGSPLVLGNLWDVTDIDIDRFSTKLLDTWGLTTNKDGETISKATAISRFACNLKFIVGAAPIVYGLPFKINAS